MPFIDRPSFIALLKRLDGVDDADVAAAAREITRRMKEGNVDWDDLLVGAGPGASDDEASDAATSLSESDRIAARAAIESLLARSDISAETASDLRDLQGDLEAGRFGAGDARYVRALAARLDVKS